ncbi:hypothetical protein TNCV_2014141 [Trichonephila clavipes]|nr:hypothetical protein TNCV_2014141 [Trichonephila clavipes]
MLFYDEWSKIGKTTDISAFEENILLLVPVYQKALFRREKISLSSQNQPYQKFSKRITTDISSLEDVTAVYWHGSGALVFLESKQTAMRYLDIMADQLDPVMLHFLP